MRPVFLFSLIVFLTASFQAVKASEVPFPETYHEGLRVKEVGKFHDLSLGLWLQHRVLYNNSNIPGPGGTSFMDMKGYDFFRQRLRMGVDVRTTDNVGGYVQLEYRGGWGGSSPGVSDPRESLPIANPFNRLQARGVRYAFMYANVEEAFNVAAGIIPLTDRVGRVLFDADWDFNVGGILLWGSSPSHEYRIAYARITEGVGGMTVAQEDEDDHLIIVDYSPSIVQSGNIGLHLYNLVASNDSQGGLGSLTGDQLWFGVTARKSFDQVGVNGMFLLNKGKISDESHTGIAVKAGADLSAGSSNINMMFLLSTGDPEGRTDNRFITLHELVGTAGYWGYTHIFTPNPPSDVNDFGLAIGNGGAGLITFQAQATVPVQERVDLQLAGGIFRSMEERNGSKGMGNEISAMIATKVGEYLSWEIGAASAFLGDIYGEDTDTVTELFSQFQFTW